MSVRYVFRYRRQLRRIRPVRLIALGFDFFAAFCRFVTQDLAIRYGSADDRSRIECDLWASSPGEAPVWLEFKRCWSASGWINKPPEQTRHWEADLNKLRAVPNESVRYFVLVGFFDFDPLSEADSTHSGVARNIREFHATQLLYEASREFASRDGDGISWV